MAVLVLLAKKGLEAAGQPRCVLFYHDGIIRELLREKINDSQTAGYL